MQEVVRLELLQSRGLSRLGLCEPAPCMERCAPAERPLFARKRALPWEEKTVSRRQFVGASAAFALASTFPSRAQSLGFQLFDTHLHFFTNDVAQYPLSGIPEARPRLLANPNTVEKVLAFMDQSGVEGCAGVQYRTAYGEDGQLPPRCRRQAPRSHSTSRHP